MKSKKVWKLLPYIGIVAWTIIISIYVGIDSASVNASDIERYRDICIESNHMKNIVNTIIDENTTLGLQEDRIFWAQLDIKLKDQLTYRDCYQEPPLPAKL